MKICVTSKGSGSESSFEQRFGRAPFFVFVDTKSGESKSIENPLLGESGGVGPRTVQLITGEGTDVVITGQAGGNATSALQASGMKIYSYDGSGTVAEAIAEYEKGNLKQFI